MQGYYIRITTYGTNEPHIIDEGAMSQAERGANYLNADEFMFHCEADCMDEALEIYWDEFSHLIFDYMAERNHP